MNVEHMDNNDKGNGTGTIVEWIRQNDNINMGYLHARDFGNADFLTYELLKDIYLYN